MNPKEYLTKMQGDPRALRRFGLLQSIGSEVLWSGAGSAIGIGLCALLSNLFFEPKDATLLIGSFGASAVLVYAVIRSPLAQPRNLVGGHVLSAVVGVAVFQVLGDMWLSSALAVSLSIVAMMLTDTVHPPGGATALIAVIGGPAIHELGFFYALLPVGAGALILLGTLLGYRPCCSPCEKVRRQSVLPPLSVSRFYVSQGINGVRLD